MGGSTPTSLSSYNAGRFEVNRLGTKVHSGDLIMVDMREPDVLALVLSVKSLPEGEQLDSTEVQLLSWHSPEEMEAVPAWRTWCYIREITEIISRTNRV